MKVTIILLITTLNLVKNFNKDKWAIIINTSKSFENYRHDSNFYRTYSLIKQYGFPDENIISINNEELTCSCRNPFQGKIYFTDQSNTRTEVCCRNQVNIDYKGPDQNNFSLINIFKGRSDYLSSNIRKLKTNQNSRIFVFINAHGGDQFVRVRTKTVILSEEFNRMLWEMYYKNMYKEILLVIDTCEGYTLFDNVTAPNLFLVSSSLKNEKGVSYLFDPYMMTQLSDRFTFLFNSLLEQNLNNRNYYYPFESLFAEIARENEFLESNVGIKKSLNREILLSDFIYFNNHLSIKSSEIHLIKQRANRNEIKDYFNNVNNLINVNHDKISLETFKRFSITKDPVEKESYVIRNFFNFAFLIFIIFLIISSLKK